MHTWTEFPYPDPAFNYDGASLEAAWDELHAGDREPFPADEALQDAWRCFHRGDFQQAVEMADEHGLAGHAVANKATGIYATYLEDNERRKAALFMEAAERAEQAIAEFPDDPNSYYFHAFNLGRYSQSISIVKALKQGIGGKVQKSLTRALDLLPEHADAHTAMGMYHAEIIDKIGKLVGGMTYGADIKQAMEHFKSAMELAPRSPIVRIEYANGLYLLYGDKRWDEVSQLYVEASEAKALDAMERLDIESARSELE